MYQIPGKSIKYQEWLRNQNYDEVLNSVSSHMTKMITIQSSGSLTIDFTPDINTKAMYNSLIHIYVNIHIYTGIDLICPTAEVHIF